MKGRRILNKVQVYQELSNVIFDLSTNAFTVTVISINTSSEMEPYHDENRNNLPTFQRNRKGFPQDTVKEYGNSTSKRR